MYRRSFALCAGVALALAVAAPARADETSRLKTAAQVLTEVKSDVPAEYWDRAHCVAVIPNLKKAAFIFGGEYGKGVMACRNGSAWGAPLFMQLAKGSWGFQAGAEEVDVVLLIMNESGMQKLLKNKVNLGADASVAAGPVGRRGSVGTDAALTAEILSYSRSKGLFAGIDLSGGVLHPDDDANQATYGRNATPATILASRDISAPTEAAPFIRALGAVSPGPETGSGGASAAATTTSPATTTGRDSATTSPAPRGASSDDDERVRAQLVDAQQLIDRLLADATPAAVGTSGSTADASRSGSTVTVERSRLIQLRSQIDAALAALKVKR